MGKSIDKGKGKGNDNGTVTTKGNNQERRAFREALAAGVLTVRTFRRRRREPEAPAE